jgi:hypothetical protein
MNCTVKTHWTRRVRLTLKGLCSDDVIEILANLVWIG